MITRRQMLKTTAATGVLGFAATIPGLGGAMAQNGLPLRRSLQGMAIDDPVLEAYREFVTKMRDPNSGLPINWVQFANIHGFQGGGFNLCPHSNWYFLPWHRAYVQMYEVAIREVTGMSDFAMPYWDWTNDPGFPAAFGDAQVNGQDNALFIAGRAMSTGDKIPVSQTGQAVMDSIYSKQTYQEFGSAMPRGQNNLDQSWIISRGTKGELESNPHDNVHCDVAGPFMCAPPSPQDPIFMMHHGNIDHIWAKWNSLGRANSTNPLWTDMPFQNNYLHPDGSQYTMTVNQLYNVEDLGYTYGLSAPTQPAIVDPGRELYLSALFGGSGAAGMVPNRTVQAAGVAEPGNPLNVALSLHQSVDLNNAIAISNSSQGMTLGASGSSAPTVYAMIRGLMPDSGSTTKLRIFVNQPDANADTPTDGNPNYVTTVGFFGHEGMEGGHGGHDGTDVAVDLTQSLKVLGATGSALSNDVTVQIVAIGTNGEPANVTVGEVELAVV